MLADSKICMRFLQIRAWQLQSLRNGAHMFTKLCSRKFSNYGQSYSTVKGWGMWPNILLSLKFCRWAGGNVDYSQMVENKWLWRRA